MRLFELTSKKDNIYKKLLAIENSGKKSLFHIGLVLDSWIHGAGMNFSDKKAWWITQNLEAFKLVKDMYVNKIPASMTLYRLSAITLPENYTRDNLLNKTITVSIANKSISSWSENVKGPQSVYDEIYARENLRRDKRFAYVIVQRTFSNQDILLTHEIFVRFFQDLLKYLPDIKKNADHKIEYGQLKYLCNAALKGNRDNFSPAPGTFEKVYIKSKRSGNKPFSNNES